MNNIQQLIRQLCPERVEYKRLGEVCEIRGRIGFRGYTRRDLVHENEGAISLSPSNIINEELNLNKCSYISWSKYEESPEIKVHNGDIVFTKTASVGKTALVKSLPQKATINPQLVLITTHVDLCDASYLSYVLKGDLFQSEVKKQTGLGSVPNISQGKLSEILIPLPPLPVQRAIAAVLDRFTQLETELETELQCRKKQYEYYRDSLLNFDNDNVQWVKLGECLGYEQPGKYIVSSKDYVDKGTPVLTAGQTFILGYTDEKDGIYKASKDNPVIIFDDFTTSFHWVTFDFKVKSSAMKMLKPKDNGLELNFRYLYYAMKCIMYEATEHSRQWISKYSMFEIPLPSLSVQRRIVGILDRFEALTTSISEGLPAEIEARRRQYEYYRDRLLTFKRKEQ